MSGARPSAAGVSSGPGGPRLRGATGTRSGAVELELAELRAWGRRLGAAAREAGAFVALYGPLGAGKTALVQAACEGAGAEEPATSPTYALVHEYESAGPRIRHLDLYRIASPAELDELGWEELGWGNAPVFVEWAERAGDRLPAERWEVCLEMGSEPDLRRVRTAARGEAPPPPPLPGAAPARDDVE